jgi:hypothetical protein
MSIVCDECHTTVDKESILRSVHGTGNVCISGRNRCKECWYSRYTNNIFECCRDSGGVHYCRSWLKITFCGISIDELYPRRLVKDIPFIHNLKYVLSYNIQSEDMYDIPAPQTVENSNRLYPRSEQKQTLNYYSDDDPSIPDDISDSDIDMEEPEQPRQSQQLPPARSIQRYQRPPPSSQRPPPSSQRPPNIIGSIEGTGRMYPVFERNLGPNTFNYM